MKLTKAEEQIMQYLWEMGEGMVRDIRDRFEEACRARESPPVEDFLGEVEAEYQPLLFRELLRLELDYRTMQAVHDSLLADIRGASHYRIEADNGTDLRGQIRSTRTR